MHNNNNNAIEEELDKYLNEINSEEELIQSNETFHGKESLRLLDDDDEDVMKEKFLLNFTQYEREIADFPKATKSQEIGTDLHIDNDEQILKQVEKSLKDTMSVIINGNKSDNASGLLELLRKEMLAQNELHAKKTESLQRIGKMHESEEMDNGQDKIDKKILSNLSEMDDEADFEGWSNYQTIEMKLAEKELFEFMNQKNEIIENLKKQLILNDEEVQKYREIHATKIQKMFRGFRCRKIHGERLRKRINALKLPKEHSAKQTLATSENEENVQEFVCGKHEKLKTDGILLDSHEHKKIVVGNRKDKDIQTVEHVEITTNRTDSNQLIDISNSEDTTPTMNAEADNKKIIDNMNRETETLKESHGDMRKPTSEEGVNENLEMDLHLEVQERKEITTDGVVNKQSKISMGILSAEKTSSFAVQGQIPTKCVSDNSLSGIAFESQTKSNQVKMNSNKKKGCTSDAKVTDNVTKQTSNALLSHPKSQLGVPPNTSTKLPQIARKSNNLSTQELQNESHSSKVVRDFNEKEPKGHLKEKVSCKEDKNNLFLFKDTKSRANLNFNDEAQSELSLYDDASLQLAPEVIQVNDNTSPAGDDKKIRIFQGVLALDLKDLILKMEHQWRESAIGWRRPTYERLLPPNDLMCPLLVKQFEVIPDHVIFDGARTNNFEQITHLELSSLGGEMSMRCLSSCSNLVCLSIRYSSFKYTEGLNKCPNLQFVDLSLNKIEFMNFSSMKRLLYLDLHGNAIKNIHNIEGCHQLKYLNLSQNSITRPSNMESLTALQYLDVSSNQLTSGRDLFRLKSLQFLDLSNNFLSVPLQGHVQDLGLLSFLNVSNNMLDEVPITANNILLLILNLDENDLAELKLDFWLPHLTLISSRRNRIASIGSLQFCQQLETLDLAINLLSEFEDIIPSIVNNFSLRKLSISNNPLNEDHSARNILRDSLSSLEILNEEKLERTIEEIKMNELQLDRGIEFEEVLKSFEEEFHEMINFAKDANNSLLKKSRIFPQLSSKCRSLAIKLRRFHERGSMQDTNDGDDDHDDHVEAVSEAHQQTKFETSTKSTENVGKVEGREVKHGRSSKKIEVLESSDESVDHSITRTNNKFNLDEEKRGSKVVPNVKIRGMKRQSIAERIKKGQSTERDLSQLHRESTASLKLEFEESMKKMALVDKDDRRRAEEKLKTAATKIQGLWRGHHLRRKVKDALEQVRMEFRQPHDIDLIDFKTSALIDSDDDDDDDGVDSDCYSSTRQWNAMKLKPKTIARSSKPHQIRQAWMEPPIDWNSIPLAGKVRPMKTIPRRYGEISLPSEPDVGGRRQSLRSQHSAREDELIREWGFKNETTKELFLKRLRKIEKCESSAPSKSNRNGRRVISAGDMSYRKREVSSVGTRFPRIESPTPSLLRRPPASCSLKEQKLPSIVHVSPCEGSDLKRSTGWGSGRKRKVLR